MYLAALIYYFQRCFQQTHDGWIVLAALDQLIGGLVWLRPFFSWRGATGWGIFGGLATLISPVVGLIWGLFALASGWQRGQRARFAITMLAAGLMVSPRLVRNYQVFDRLIPVKSNLAFELFQSQCVQAGGVLHHPIFISHPNAGDNPERRAYDRLGETAYLEQKWNQFYQAVRDNPLDFVQRTANRFLEATLLYVPFNPKVTSLRPGMARLAQWVYPTPFLCLVLLQATSPWQPLTWAQRVVIGVYLAYLQPYVLVGYYDRYKFPLLVWGLLPRREASGEDVSDDLDGAATDSTTS